MAVHARKRFGQHFLEPAWVAKVVRAIDPKPDEIFLEIGPGRGALTRPLAAAARHVVAYEIDRDLAALLRGTLPNLTVVEGDFLDADLGFRPGPFDQARGPAGSGATPIGAIRVAGNLPYNVAAPILFRLLALYAAGVPLVDATLMLQREVADRLTAVPGTREYGVLGVLVQRAAGIRRVLDLPPGAFRPAPQVHSALVRLQFHAPEPTARDEPGFARLVQAIFTRRRKMLANALLALPESEHLSPAVALRAAGLDGRRRPETLTIPELVRLSDAYATQSA